MLGLPDNWRDSKWALPGVALAVGLAVAVVYLVQALASGPSEAQAWVVCRDFMERELVALASAEWPPITEATIRSAGDRWTVTAHVDSQNALGAMLRTRFECVAEHVDGDRWRLIRLHER